MSAAPTDWILLRGWAREARHWDGFVERWAAAFPHARTTAADLPGSGERRMQKSPTSIAAIALAVRAAHQASTSGPRRVGILALSLGSMVALQWAATFPDEIDRLILIAGSHGALSPPWQRLRPSAWSKLIFLPWLPVELRERHILELTSARYTSPSPAADAVAQRFAVLARARPVSTRNAWAQLIAAARHRGGLDSVRAPSLVMVGARDRLVDPRCSEALARSLGAPLRTHPTAGHDVPLDDPGWVIEQARSWLISSDLLQNSDNVH